MIRKRVKNKECFLKINSFFIDKISINITLEYEKKNINSVKNYKGFSVSEENIEGEKLIGGKITIVLPVSLNGNVLFKDRNLRYILSHEITHLYDDWIDLKNGGKGIFINQKKNKNNTLFLNNNIDNEDTLIRSITWMTYMSIKTEQNVFISQTMQELRHLNCSFRDYRSKAKKTVAYSNIIKTKNNFFKEVKNADKVELFWTNQYIMDSYRKSTIPKYDMGQFNDEKYRNMLLKWGDRISRKLLAKYYDIVQLFSEELTETYTINNCLFIQD